jgi:tetratricopeptide (TPR) repeat protein
MSGIRQLTVVSILIAGSILSAKTATGQNISAESLYQQAQTEMDKGNLDKAHELMDKALDLVPDNCEYHFLQGDIQGRRAQQASIFTKIGKAKSCRKHYKKAVELCPDSAKYVRALMQCYLHAPGIAGGDKQKAHQLLTRIFTLDSVTGFWAQADIAWQGEKYHEVEKIYLTMLEQAMDTLDVLASMGHLFNLQLHEYPQARNYYLRALAVDPENWSIVYQVGRIAVLEKKNTAEAIGYFKKYVAQPEGPDRPDHAAAYWRMGMAYEQLDDLDSARHCYKTSLEIKPGYKDAKKSLKKLKQ